MMQGHQVKGECVCVGGGGGVRGGSVGGLVYVRARVCVCLC